MNLWIGGIIEDGGEGVIMRKTRSLYEHGRSRNLIKLKTSLGDKEGLVVGVAEDHIELKLPTGQIFRVPSKSVHIPTPSLGSVVTFSFEIHSRRDLPVNPEIYRVRPDLAWEEVVFNSIKEKKFLNDQSQTEAFTTHPRGYWSPDNMRTFLENFARTQYNLDPLVPETWYNIPYEAIYHSKTGRTILQKYKGHYAALTALFPELTFDSAIIQTSWSELRHRRKFFENYALEHGFDPLVPENWYSQSRDKIMATRGIRIVLSYHNDSLSQALTEVFPDVEIDPSKLPTKSKWSDPQNRIEFLQQYASEHGFEITDTDNWYNHSKAFMSAKGALNVLYYHQGSISKALRDLLPTVGFQKSKFLQNKSEWNKIENRRKFFEDYAKAHRFDPLVATNWYSQSRKRIMVMEGASKVVFHHQGSVARALQSLFPDIGFDSKKYISQSSWVDPEDRRLFFEQYAEDNKFDPLVADHWYKQFRKDIMAAEGAPNVISFHKDSIPTALVELFPEIEFDKSKFWSQVSINEGRELFESYAKHKNFNPLLPENWYSQPKSELMSFEGLSQVIASHKGSVPSALHTHFPELKFSREKFDQKKIQNTSTLAPTEQAVKLVKEKGYSQKLAAQLSKVSERTLQVALQTNAKGRQVGIPGRPRVFSKEEEGKVVNAILEAKNNQKPLTFSQFQEKCKEIYYQSHNQTDEPPSFCRDFMKRILKDHKLNVNECILGAGETHLSWLVKYGMPTQTKKIVKK